MFARWHDAAMVQLPIFIRNMSYGCFDPQRQVGYYMLLLAIKEMRKVAPDVKEYVNADLTDAGLELKIFLDELNSNVALIKALDTEEHLISAFDLTKCVLKPKHDQNVHQLEQGLSRYLRHNHPFEAIQAAQTTFEYDQGLRGVQMEGSCNHWL